MNLFDVPYGSRIRVRSNRISLHMLDDLDVTVAEDVVWEGTATDRYFPFHGVLRRLIVDINMDFWKGYGIWLRDIPVELV